MNRLSGYSKLDIDIFYFDVYVVLDILKKMERFIYEFQKVICCLDYKNNIIL